MTKRRRKSATVSLQVRMKEPLRRRIEKAAKTNGVSMNAEAVARIDRSFIEESTIAEMLGGDRGADFALMFTRLLVAAMRRDLGVDPLTIPKGRWQFVGAISGILEGLQSHPADRALLFGDEDAPWLYRTAARDLARFFIDSCLPVGERHLGLPWERAPEARPRATPNDNGKEDQK